MHPDLSTLPMQIERECEACGKRYMVARADYVRGRRRFCSYACWYTPKVERTCEHCGKVFNVPPSTVRHHGAKYCGRGCRDAANRPPDGPERTCSRCGETKPIEQFQKRGEYRLTFCMDCWNAARRDKYANAPEFAGRLKLAAHDYRRANPEHVAAKKKEDYWKHRERYLARAAVGNAVKAGKLTRLPCWCGDPDTEAHHHNGYDEAHRLDVVWLCRAHHGLAHRKSRIPTEQ